MNFMYMKSNRIHPPAYEDQTKKYIWPVYSFGSSKVEITDELKTQVMTKFLFTGYMNHLVDQLREKKKLFYKMESFFTLEVHWKCNRNKNPTEVQ